MFKKYFYKLVKPNSKIEDLRRREFILNILLLSAIFLLIVAVIVNATRLIFGDPVVYENSAMPIKTLLLILFTFLALYALSRKGYFFIASYILLGIYFSLAIYMTYRWGIELPTALLFYVLIIVMSGVLINTRFAFLVTIISSLSILILSYLQNKGITSPNLNWKYETWETAEVVVLSIIFLIIATVSWLSNREIEKSLKRARKSEAELKEERDSLEIKIEERTRELKEVQMEKVSQLYRFAEFGRLSSGFFHDLVNPLTAVSLNMEKIKNSPNVEIMEVKSYLAKAVAATKRMEKFITTVRKQITKQENKIVFSLTEEITQVIGILLHKAQEAGVAVNFSPYVDIQLYGNSVKFSQAITNLVANAIDAYEDFKADRREVNIKLGEKNDMVYLVVEDWGAGISQKDIEKIFQPFYTTKKFEKGTGIGLSLTKDIFEKDFHGNILVQSKKNKGSRFTIKIPKNRNNVKITKNPELFSGANCAASRTEGKNTGITDNYLNHLALSQQANGSFMDFAGSESVLCTAIILSCLNNLKETEEIEKIKKRAVEFLLLKKGNNWIISENTHINFYALAALNEYNSEIISGTDIAKIVMNLTYAEAKEGGPYYSWLGGKDKTVDLAANASVAYFLSLHNVQLPELEKLIETAVNNKNFKSSFYASFCPVIYFISKLDLSINIKHKLIDYILSKKNKDGGWGNFLDNILVVSSLKNLGYDGKKLEDEIKYLKNYSAENIKRQCSFYTATKEGSSSASTDMLNIAFFLEAIESVNIQQTPRKQEDLRDSAMDEDEKEMMDKILDIAEKRFGELRGDLSDFAMEQVKKTIKINPDKQMSLMAYYFRKALGEKGENFPDKLIAKMGLANIFFWTAFIIYDDFWDEEGEPRILPTANLYARGFTKFFTSVMPSSSGFSDYFRFLMDKLDAANTWETVYCRAKVDGDIVIIPRDIPDYGNYDVVYEPASAHILGPLAMLYHLGHKEDSEETRNMISYFRNYLIAMQFNDDMHDWEKDLKRGHLSTVVVMLLHDFKEAHPDRNAIDMGKDMEELKKIFWFKTIKKACEAALKHTEESRKALKAMKLIEDIAPLERFIIITENAAKEALKEQKDTIDFLGVYSN